MSEQTLYEKFGGSETIGKVVDTLKDDIIYK